MTQLRVAEIFGPTLQGEGRYAGLPTIFVRLGGCDFRCTWCDSMHAVDPKYRPSWVFMSTEEVFNRVVQLASNRAAIVTLSGGNPALQPCEELIDFGSERSLLFAMETQGSAFRPWFRKLHHLCLSPKPPSSGMACDRAMLRACIDVGPRDTIIKVPIAEPKDYEWARDLAGEFPDVEWYLSVVNGNLDPTADPTEHRKDLLQRYQWIAERVLRDRWLTVRVLPQLHVLLWGNEKGR